MCVQTLNTPQTEFAPSMLSTEVGQAQAGGEDVRAAGAELMWGVNEDRGAATQISAVW